MRVVLLGAALLCGCKSQGTDPVEGTGPATFALTPPVGGQGTTLEVFVDASRSVFEFDSTDLSFGDGIEVASVTVHDNFVASATVTIADDAELGLRDVDLDIGSRHWQLPESFSVIAESLTIDPGSAKMGELLDVALVGHNTDWSGTAWASFGEGVDVLEFRLLSPTLAAATISVHPDTLPGLRDVSVESAGDVLTLYRGFTVDRAVVTAFFEPESAYQGDTVDFTLTGVGTNFVPGSQIEFWDNGVENTDIVVEEFEVLDEDDAYGVIRLSNAARVGLRDVMVRAGDDVLIPDAFEVLDAPPDLSSVAVGLGFDIFREIDDASGALFESVEAYAYFVIPLDPPCGSPPPMGEGPMPYDLNGVFASPPDSPPEDCPPPETVSAGDYVWFESPANIVTLHKDIISSTGQVIYRGIDLTLDDYRFGEVYDLHTQGDPDGIPEVLVDKVQPTVPADYYLLSPELWGGYTHARVEPFDYTWTPALTYPTAIFVTGVYGTLEATGESGFAGCLPWDDGAHRYRPSELLLLEPGPVTFALSSYIEGRLFGLPFSSIQDNQSDSVLSTAARMTLE